MTQEISDGEFRPPRVQFIEPPYTVIGNDTTSKKALIPGDKKSIIPRVKDKSTTNNEIIADDANISEDKTVSVKDSENRKPKSRINFVEKNVNAVKLNAAKHVDAHRKRVESPYANAMSTRTSLNQSKSSRSVVKTPATKSGVRLRSRVHKSLETPTTLKGSRSAPNIRKSTLSSEMRRSCDFVRRVATLRHSMEAAQDAVNQGYHFIT